MDSPAGCNRAAELAAAARRDLALAELADRPADRYAAAHLAALRAAASVLAARPLTVQLTPRRRRRLTSAWDQLPVVAPELAEWAARFAAGAAKRAAAEAGFRDVVNAAEADDLLGAARTFVALTAALLDVEPAPLAG
jgi:hypothetical protein